MCVFKLNGFGCPQNCTALEKVGLLTFPVCVSLWLKESLKPAKVALPIIPWSMDLLWRLRSPAWLGVTRLICDSPERLAQATPMQQTLQESGPCVYRTQTSAYSLWTESQRGQYIPTVTYLPQYAAVPKQQARDCDASHYCRHGRCQPRETRRSNFTSLRSQKLNASTTHARKWSRRRVIRYAANYHISLNRLFSFSFYFFLVIKRENIVHSLNGFLPIVVSLISL